MHIKENATGIQHIGIPTKDMDATIRFYESLGFERLYETRNKEEDDGRVIFFQLHDLVLETYEVKDPKMVLGAIDHFSINVKDIDDAFRFINEAGMNNTDDFIHFLPLLFLLEVVHMHLLYLLPLFFLLWQKYYAFLTYP